MIAFAELNPHKYPLTPKLEDNLNELLGRLNVIRVAYGKPMTITSGLRSEAQQEGLIASGKSTAVHSKHLTGQAADISDPDGAFHSWCKANERILKAAQLWCEERQGPWQHLQSVPPASGKLWFMP